MAKVTEIGKRLAAEDGGAVGRFGAHEAEHRGIRGFVGKAYALSLGEMAAQPGQVSLDRPAADVKAIALVVEAQGRQIALEAARLVQHGRVDGPPRWTCHVVGADTVEETLRIGPRDPDLAEGGLVEDRGILVRLGHFAPHLIEPSRLAESELRFAVTVEVERTLPSIDLAEVGVGGPPARVQRGLAQAAGACELAAGIADLVVRAQHLRRPGHEDVEGVELGRETFGIRLVQIDGRAAVDDRVGQRHARAAAGGDADRVHAAAEKKASGLGRLAEQEGAVRREALRPVQQHAHLGRLEHRQAMEGVQHHRLEMIPVLGQELKGEIRAQPRRRIDGLAKRLEAADEQALRLIADVEVGVVVGEGRQMALGTRHGLGEQIEMLARQHRCLDIGVRRDLAAP